MVCDHAGPQSQGLLWGSLEWETARRGWTEPSARAATSLLVSPSRAPQLQVLNTLKPAVLKKGGSVQALTLPQSPKAPWVRRMEA